MATYTYTYNLAGGTYNGASTYKQTYNTNNPASSKLITPERDGYKLRWFTITASSTGDQLGSNAAPGQQIVVASNLTLTAIWDEVHYIKHDPNGGYYENSSDWKYSLEKIYGSNVNLLKAPVRTGYDFVNWKNLNDGNPSWNPGQAFGNDENVTMQAIWRRNSVNTYSIKFNLDGGTGASNQTLNIGTSYTLPTPTKAGCEFSHWVSNRDNDYDGTADIYQAGAVYKKSNNVTFTAVWKTASTYNVMYYRPKTESGSGSAIADGYDTQIENKSAASFTVTNGFTTYIFGHTVKGWFDHFIPQPIQNGRVTNLFSFSAASLGYLHKTNGTLTKNWDTDEMTSNYIAVTAGQKYVYSYHMDYGKVVGSKRTPHPWTRIWFYNSSKAIISNSMIELSEEDNFDASGENTYHYTITAPSGAAYIRICSRYLRYGYAQLVKGTEFEAWSLNSTDLGNLYQAYDSFSNPEKKDVYLLGIYECNQRTITFNANGGSNAPFSQKTWYREIIKLTTSVPSKDGYAFKGWSTDSTATEATWDAGEDFLGQNNNFTLYAVWEPIANCRTKIKGVWRDGIAYEKVNGKWRESDTNTKINENWREGE